MKEEILDVKKDLVKLQEESFAMSLLKQQKSIIKKLFIVIYVLIGCVICLSGYLFYVLNDIQTETIQTIEDVDVIENSEIKNG